MPNQTCIQKGFQCLDGRSDQGASWYGMEIQIDFKMSNLKSQICEWLHHVWLEMKDKKFMVVKVWEKVGLMKAWEVDLQVVPMEENTIKPLFTTIANIEDVVNINVQFSPL